MTIIYAHHKLTNTNSSTIKLANGTFVKVFVFKVLRAFWGDDLTLAKTSQFEQLDYPIELATESLRKKGAPFQQLLVRGIVCFDKKEYELAKRLFERALELNSEDVNIYSFLAVTNFHLMNYQQAIKYGKIANGKFGYVPTHGPTVFIEEIAGLYAGLAKSYGMLERYDLSTEALNKAIEIGGPSAEVCATLGTTYSLKGNKARAVEFYNKALELDPSYEWARKKLARITSD